MSARSESGFTLVEILVALLVMSILAAAGTAMLVQTLAARDQIAERTEAVKALELSRALLKSDLGQAAMRPTRSAFGGAGGLFFDGGVTADGDGDRLIAFVRRGWENPGAIERRSSLQTVIYSLEDGALIRLTRTRPDPYQTTPERRQVLLEGVSEARVEFARAGQWSSVWRGALGPGGVAQLPEAVRLVMTVEGLGEIDQVFLTSAGS